MVALFQVFHGGGEDNRLGCVAEVREMLGLLMRFKSCGAVVDFVQHHLVPEARVGRQYVEATAARLVGDGRGGGLSNVREEVRFAVREPPGSAPGSQDLTSLMPLA